MRLRVASLLSGGLLLLGMALLGVTRMSPAQPASAATVTVSITNGGFSPQIVNVSTGDTVTWTNNSSNPQTINSTLQSTDPNFFYSGFIFAGNSWSHTFANAGSFDYKSNTTQFTGTVVAASGGGGGSTPTNTPTPTPGGGGGGGGAAISITDSGFSPQSLTVDAGTSVTWTNNSTNPQTVNSTLQSTDPNFFYSGFIFAGASWSHTFANGGTFNYKSNTTQFTGSVTVSGGGGGVSTPTSTPPAGTATPTPTSTPTLPPGTTATHTPTPPPGSTSTPTPGGGSQATATATVTPTRTPTPAATATPTQALNKVSIGSGGFSPQSLTVSPGTTVTWTNNTNIPQTVNQVQAQFISGFIYIGKTWSYTFATPGVFQYKSATSGFTGTVTVTSTPGGGSSKPFSPMGPGWNLVTYGGSGGDPGHALSQLGNEWTAAYHWDGSKWRRYFRPGLAPAFLNTLTTLTPGQPLWILTTTAIP